MLLQHLITFCRVVEEGSFTRAAQVQNLTQPSVTKQVGALEDHLQVQLFTRQGKQVHLTPAGELVYDYARQVIHLVAQCEAAVQELRSPGSGSVTVGCVHTIGLFTLPDLLAAFVREHPRVKINVRTGNNRETVAMLLHGEVDLGLITTPQVHERIDVIPLFEDPLVAVASPSFAADLPPVLGNADLARLPFIGYVRGARFRNTIDQILEEMGIQPKFVMEFDNHEAIKTMVGLGFGVALEPVSAVQRELDGGQLVRLNVPGLPRSSRTTSLILRRGERRSAAVNAFLALLERRYAVAINPAP
ncbi:DNA-binding transcriptional LysR family regulator [Symbiobacterium terraclitae]|uniref:DNA-binding transcriptional LysR family regulator n=1 Tax=Symbiobacterium terraclitae TaxID=557451 RepID=A0ABS4JMK3_9FIRM|nr:LysR family transcriptional regulator [Symbiobacterium terraclitae]MBP2016772.1 DNA-binding transcriptional LysR family regulator [Symbiobacterium terraclitae]